MRKALLLSVGFLFCANVAFGQAAGFIGIYSDANSYVNCRLTDNFPLVHEVYVVHRGTTGATASQFKVEASAAVTLTYLGETSHVATTIGDSQTGACLFYDSCLPGTILLMTISYFGVGTSTACSELAVVPYPGLNSVLAVDCSDAVWEIDGQVMYVNGDVSCECHIVPVTEPGEEGMLAGITALGCSVPVEEQSWGRVKALYR